MGLREQDQTLQVHLSALSLKPEPLLDPGLLVVQVPEELVQAVGLVEPGAASSSHALDLGEASVHAAALLLHLGRVKGVAGHQTVRLAVQVLQPVL